MQLLLDQYFSVGTHKHLRSQPHASVQKGSEITFFSWSKPSQDTRETVRERLEGVNQPAS